MRRLILALVSLSIIQPIFAQKSPIKFGNVSMEEMTMSSYPKDSSASAVVLVDYGEAYLTLTSVMESLTFEKHVRIKVLNKRGINLASIEVPLYYSGSDEEKVINLKASTYNLENGKIVESKMAKDAVFKKKINRNHNELSFALPNVKEGSVIEYSYKITSDFITSFPNWKFQWDVPVKHSEYWAMLPDFFTFQKYMQGYLSPTTYEVKSKPNVGFTENAHHWVMKDVPAFKEEPYMTTENDYISKINFALSYYQFPGGILHEVMGSWEKLSNDLIEDEDFGKVIDKSGFLKDQVAQLTAGVTEPIKKIEAIHTYLKENIEWDGTKDMYAGNFKKILESKKGTSADINLLLASMLDKAGFSVDMIALSTRDHGFIRQAYPMRKQLNYVICAVRLEDKTLLLDATEKYLPMDILPERCLNGQGLVVSKLNRGWIDVVSNAKSKTSITAEMMLTDKGDLKGKLQYSRDGYDAYDMRKSYHKDGEEAYLKDFLGTKTWQVDKSEFQNMKDLKVQAKEIHEVVIPEHASTTGNVIYINPFLEGNMSENPFKLEKREYPVDYGTKQENVYMAKITVPEGYQVDELPPSKIFMMPGNSAKYMYSMNLIGNTITLTSNLQINKSLFIQDEYPNLREFYNQVVAKQAEQIVLKKK
ncbi:MAG TPA: DUF3857 and transglutaminase domain-containing protein [Cyclobacteriaceae bacterium]|nr:DUF3857 and transglutaminase domain-containing protein [Cyclobacteriaceae bacterium]